MPTRDEVAYFGAGPAPLPTSVLTAAAAALQNYNNTGLSLAEISHRSPTATSILASTKAALTTLLSIPSSHEILFLHGGGSGEFSAVVFNMVAAWVEQRRLQAEKECEGNEEKILERVRRELKEELRLDYLVTGSWSLKASQEAANILAPLGPNFINIATDARKANNGAFGLIPDESTWKLSPKSAFVYYCDNETVDGVEFPSFPSILQADPTSSDPFSNPLVVADMSSNFLSRHVDVSKYAVIFAGAQKNLGITDTTVLILQKSLLNHPPLSFLHSLGIWSPPTILHWPTIATSSSLYNTMPIFSIWIIHKVLLLLLSAQAQASTPQKTPNNDNNQNPSNPNSTTPSTTTTIPLQIQESLSLSKSTLLYKTLSTHPKTYHPTTTPPYRSRMNITFRLRSPQLEKAFLDGAEMRLLLGLKGHRSVGGIRVSNYNAVPMADVERLVEYMEEFARGEGDV
ncbi:Phosphoserine transaminase [Toensbergia leucococca]|nr:Phosphoserine transaminase [Toensbergia leucococca]